MITDELDKLNKIYNDREAAADVESVLLNFTSSSKIVLFRNEKEFNSCDKMPTELLTRLIATVRGYINERTDVLKNIKVLGIPEEDYDDD